VLQIGLISPLLLGEPAGSQAKLGSGAPLLTESGRSPSLKSLAMAGSAPLPPPSLL